MRDGAVVFARAENAGCGRMAPLGVVRTGISWGEPVFGLGQPAWIVGDLLWMGWRAPMCVISPVNALVVTRKCRRDAHLALALRESRNLGLTI